MADWSLAGDGQDIAAHDRSGGGPFGVTCVSSGSINTKGAWAALTAPTFASSWLAVHLHGFSALTGSPSAPLKALIDIAVGSSGSEQTLIADLLFMQDVSIAGVPAAQTCLLPLGLPVTAELSARVQSSDGAPSSFGVSLSTVACGWGASASGTACETWGANTSASDGVNVTPGTSPAFGAYAELTSASGIKADWLVLAFGIPGSYPSSGSTHAYLVDIAVGSAGNEVTILPSWPVVFDELGQCLHPFTQAIPVSLPAGSRISVRAATSTTGPNLSVIAYATGG